MLWIYWSHFTFHLLFIHSLTIAKRALFIFHEQTIIEMIVKKFGKIYFNNLDRFFNPFERNEIFPSFFHWLHWVVAPIIKYSTDFLSIILSLHFFHKKVKDKERERVREREAKTLLSSFRYFYIFFLHIFWLQKNTIYNSFLF